MTPVRRTRLAGLVAAALAAAAGLVGLATAPASAALCSGQGVNVVVDFNGLGGGVQKGCDPGGAGRSGDKVFPAAGFALTYAQRQPGFVCRVNGAPNSDPCVNASPANAYWGLYWSDGRSGKWTYSTAGVGGVSVPEGGFLAFSWQNGGDADPPGAAPVNSQPAPTKQPTTAPTRQPTKQPTRQPSKAPGGGVAQPGTTPRPTPAVSSAAANRSATPTGPSSASPKAGAGSSRTSSTSPSPTDSAQPTPEDEATAGLSSSEQVDSSFAPEEEHSGLPTWVPIVVLVGLAGAAGGALLWRRRGATD
jgi:hypothetical protein